VTDTTNGSFRTFSAVPAAPDPAGAVDLAGFIERLRLLRAHAGSPSFRVLAKRVGPLLKPPQDVTHSTVSDAFDPTRRRLNLELVAAIVQALGVSEAQVPRWRAACVAAHAARRPAGTAGVFRQLPAELSTFTGRRDELAELMGLVGSGGAAAPPTVVVSAIEGMAGIGKTQLVIRAAHELVRAGRFADVQLYVNLRGFDADAAPADPADVLDSFLRQLEVPARRIPAERDERAAMFRDRIAGRDALVLLDNAADEAQVADLIPADPRCLVLVTSRRSLAGLDGARLFRLDVFPLVDALELLARVVGDERVAAEPEAAVEVAELCGLLPLAVSLAAARLRSRPAWSLARLARHLRDSGLDAVRAGSRELRPVFDLSYRELPAATARAFRLMSLHPGRGFTTGAVAALTGTPLGAAQEALEVLVDENLVEQRTPDRYELHDLLRAYAVERAETDESAAERDQALARLVSWYQHTAENVSRAVESRRLLETLPARPGEPEPPRFASALEAMAWYDAERENLSAVLLSSADAGWHELTLRLPVTLLGCYQMRTDWARWRSAYETGLAAARRIGDRTAQNRLLNGLGLALYDVQEYSEAIEVYSEGLAVAEELGDRPQVASILGNIAGCWSRLGDYETSERMHRRGLELFREIGNPQNLASSLTNLGNMLHEAKRLEESHEAQSGALVAAREAGNRRYEAIIAFNRAEVCMDLGRPAEAEEDYRLALTAAQEAGDRPVEAEALRSLARPLRALSRPQEARVTLRAALAVFEALGSPEAVVTRERLAELGDG
jgi:tetratricopeptide (TPR) repeat protein